MNSTCFSTSDPAAANASVVYDFNTDRENLWEKLDWQAPLPLCSAVGLPPADPPCLVCREQKVFTVCRSLADGLKVMMEAMGRKMEIRPSDCPLLHSDDGPSWQLPCVIAGILLFLFLFLVVVFGLICYSRRRKTCPRRQHEREENGTPGENGSALLPAEASSPV